MRREGADRTITRDLSLSTPAHPMAFDQIPLFDERVASRIDAPAVTTDVDVADLVARLVHEAAHDPLTGLLNRASMMRRLDDLLATASSRERVQLLFVDVDHFKLVNDTFGHHAGDQLLCEFANRLRDCIRTDDLIGRFGGDEFVVACRLDDGDDPPCVAERIVAAMAEPFEVEGRSVVSSASIGLAVSDAGDTSRERLLQSADTALFEAKRLGRGRVEVFSPELRRKVVDRVELESELRAAIPAGQLRLRYQPQVDLHSGRVVGVEALVRWRHPTRGLLSPDEFIPVAEESGLIVPLGRWVLGEACRQMAEWQRYTDVTPPSVTVNVSPLQLDDAGFMADVTDSLGRFHLPPRCLYLEVTETALMSRTTGLPTLAALRDLGCYVGIDDFGTGYSSLARLRGLPVEVLKIDRTFVAGLGTDSYDSAIVASIMSMAIAMGMHVIAEGVEHARQAEALVRLGCQFAQGYLFSAPVPPNEIAELCRRRLWRPISADGAAADGIGGPVINARAARVGHRRFIHEFLDQIGLPIDSAPRTSR